MHCDICKASAVTWQHADGALCDVCKRAIEHGDYANHPALPTGLRYEPNGSFELLPWPDGHGQRLAWVPR